MDEETLERFMKFVDKRDDGCWYWTGGEDKDGYGRFYFQGKTRYAHRLIYWHCYGELTKGLVVCHTCRNKCVNPEHLEEDTKSKNQLDRVRDNTDIRGEKNHKSKLTVEQVLEIRRRSNDNQKLLSEEFGVSSKNINLIINRTIWKHL